MSDSSDPNPDKDILGLDFTSSSDPLANALSRAGLPNTTAPAEPAYRVLGDSKIPVSKQRGQLWKSRKDTGLKCMKDMIVAWDEAIRYFNNDQSGHRDSGGDGSKSGNRNVARRLNEQHSSTENIVFSNINGQVPSLYAKNPIVSFSSGINQDEDQQSLGDSYARALEKLVNTLFGMQLTPGVGLKPKMKRAIVIALLTNCAWLEVGYVSRDKSSENAQQTLIALSKEMEEAKTTQEIAIVEAKLIALEERIEFLRPSGPYVRVRLGHKVIVDPDRNNNDLSDANYVIVGDVLPTEYINAVYGKGNDKNQVMSLYEPTHILDGGAIDPDEDNLSVFQLDKHDYSSYGFSDSSSFNKAKRTAVWWVWDKTTRRLELYADNTWTWPIWVWDDPYELAGFFPFTQLSFHENPVGPYAKGQVSYYLDQQDELNEINDEKRRALSWVRRNIGFNKNRVSQSDVDAFLKGPDGTATPFDLAEGMKIEDVVFAIPPPSMQFTAIFDKAPIYAAIDRIAATNEVERGGQFKTNTTNKAVDYYATQGNARNDEQLDAVEDCIAAIGWQLAQLCMRFMPPDVVKQLTGFRVDDWWKPIDPIMDYGKWSMSVVGGSTTKVSSSARKQEAIQIGQVLAQFVRAAPASVLTATLEMFAKAFDDVVIQQEDWEKIEAEVVRTLSGGAGGAGDAGNMPQQGTGAGAGAGEAPDPIQAVVSLMEQLPPPVLKAIGIALTKGATPQEIFQQLQQQLTQEAQQQPGQSQPQGATNNV